jgi:hypothetical protein
LLTDGFCTEPALYGAARRSTWSWFRAMRHHSAE